MSADPAAAIAAALDGPGALHSPFGTRSWTSDTSAAPNGMAGALTRDDSRVPPAGLIAVAAVGVGGGEELWQATATTEMAASSTARHAFARLSCIARNPSRNVGRRHCTPRRIQIDDRVGDREDAGYPIVERDQRGAARRGLAKTRRQKMVPAIPGNDERQ